MEDAALHCTPTRDRQAPPPPPTPPPNEKKPVEVLGSAHRAVGAHSEFRIQDEFRIGLMGHTPCETGNCGENRTETVLGIV
jgi:hypothetical protein